MEEKKDILVLSVSKVKTYKQCPRKYYFTYIEKLPKKDWDFFDLGTFVHGVLERFHETYRNDSEKMNFKKMMKDCFKKQKIEMDLKKPLSESILLEAKTILTEYLKNIEDKGLGSEILTLEEEFQIELCDFCNLKGIVDRTDKDSDGIYHIKDYKTSKDTKYMDPDQLRSYGIYLLDKFPTIDRFRGSYIMLRFGTYHLNYDFNMEDTVKAKKELISYAEKILEEGKWICRPSKLCDWCDFQNVCFSSWD